MTKDTNGQMELSLFGKTPDPEDQDQRLIIRRRLDTNMMVLAGAGAGKTHELVERMVGLLGRSDVDIRNMVAITFTRKAAGELRTRFYERLQEEAAKEGHDRSSGLRDAADRIDQCFIGTIHAFCSRLLRERPLEAGLPFDFKELDERDEPRARRRAWIAFLNERVRSGDAIVRRLLDLRLDMEKVYGFYSKRCAFPELRLKPTEGLEPDLKDAVERIVDLVTSVLPFLNEKGRDKPDKFTSCAMQAERYRERRGLETVEEQATYLGFFDSTTLDKGGIILNGWADSSLARKLRDETVPALRKALIVPALAGWKQFIFSLLAGVVDEAMVHYAETRRAAGAVTFEDLLLKARDLLRDHSDVRTYFQSKYRVILVDEFQDTDPIQAEVLMFLTSEDVAENDWQKVNPRPGSLFVVGDEKQSIYRFRRADVDTFRFVRDRIGDTGGEVVRLNTSFRSLGNLCGWLNRTFEPILGAQPERYQALYEPLLKYRPDGTDPLSVRKISFPKDLGGRDDVVGLDAERIANFIAAAVSGRTDLAGDENAPLGKEPSYGDFMILTRNKTRLNEYAQALEARGIPYDLVGGNDLGKSDEVAALTQMLEAAANPEDPVALAGFLRGPIVGCSDSELLVLRTSGARFDYTFALPEVLDAGVAEKVGRAFEQLTRASELMRRQTPTAAFESLTDELGLIPWFAAASQDAGSSRAGALVRLLANVRRWERQGLHWVEIISEMRALIEEVDFEISGMTLEAGEPNAVRVMNLHQAKGLQAQVVFLADPYDKFYGSIPPGFHVHRFGEHRYLSMTVSDKPENSRSYKTIAEPVGWEEDEAEEQKYLEAEESRLRYVAATRARGLLVVSTSEQHRGAWAELDPFLAEVEELPEFEDPPPPRPEPLQTSLEPTEEERVRRMASSGQASWRMEIVSDGGGESMGSDAFLQLTGERRGADFGTAVHDVLDLVIGKALESDGQWREFVRRSFDVEFAAPVMEAVGGFLDSSLFREIRSASAVYSEIPFAVAGDQGAGVFVRGRIDLIYRAAEGWKLVDFKTDAATTEDEVERVATHYRDQVAAYGHYWTRVTGERVVSKGLWLTSLNRFVPID